MCALQMKNLTYYYSFAIWRTDVNVYCKIETQEDYDYFFQYDPDRGIQYPCLFNIDDVFVREMVGLLIIRERTLEKNAEWITVEKMKQLAFVRSLEL